MGTPAAVALWLGLGALPVCLWAAWSDLSRMKIPNRAVLALVGVFAILGLALLPLDSWSLSDWAWRWTHLVVALLLGMLLNAANLIGAGDAKFVAAAAPFVALSDWRAILWLFPLMLLAGWALHRSARHGIGLRLAPDWVSWSSGNRFPMGVALGATLVGYLVIAAAA